MTVRADFTFIVGDRLLVEYDNGRTYYELDGKRLRHPRRADQQANPDYLAWHNEFRYRILTWLPTVCESTAICRD